MKISNLKNQNLQFKEINLNLKKAQEQEVNNY